MTTQHIDGKYYKKCDVLLLETTKASHIHYIPEGQAKMVDNKLTPIKNPHLMFCDEATAYGFPPRHIYILSDDEIKEGDWCVIDLAENSRPVQVVDLNHNHSVFTVDIGEGYAKPQSLKKIIATTDASLFDIVNNGDPNPNDTTQIRIPSIPQWFVDYYIEQYNKENVIREVLVEVEKHMKTHYEEATASDGGYYNKKIVEQWESVKVNKNNEIFPFPDELVKLDALANLLEKAGVRQYLNVNKFGYSQIERDIVKLFEK